MGLISFLSVVFFVLTSAWALEQLQAAQMQRSPSSVPLNSPKSIPPTLVINNLDESFEIVPPKPSETLSFNEQGENPVEEKSKISKPEKAASAQVVTDELHLNSNDNVQSHSEELSNLFQENQPKVLMSSENSILNEPVIVNELPKRTELATESSKSSKDDKSLFSGESNDIIKKSVNLSSNESVEPLSNFDNFSVENATTKSLETPSVKDPITIKTTVFQQAHETDDSITFSNMEDAIPKNNFVLIDKELNQETANSSESPLPDSLPLGQINVNLLAPFTDQKIKQFQLNFNFPIFNHFEMTITLQELFQGEIAPQIYETTYQMGALFGHLSENSAKQLSLLSGTLTTTSSEAIRIENLSAGGQLKSIQFQLQQESTDLILVGIVEKDAPSGTGIEGYQSKVSFQMGQVSANYKLRLERQTDPKIACPWLTLDHELTTQPADIFYFHSFIDHICNFNKKGSDRMNIEIILKSALWPLANLHLNQTFNFASVGDELMQATHSLFDIAVSGFWNGDSVYSKTLTLNPSSIGSQVLPLLPAKLKAIFTRYQLADGHSRSYTVNIEKSHDEQFTPERLSLSVLAVKITGAFISATTIVLSANGAFFSAALAQLEFLIEHLLASIEQPELLPLDIWKFQLAIEITAFIIILFFFHFILSFANLFETVNRLLLSILFVEISVATIVQLIALGFF